MVPKPDSAIIDTEIVLFNGELILAFTMTGFANNEKTKYRSAKLSLLMPNLNL